MEVTAITLGIMVDVKVFCSCHSHLFIRFSDLLTIEAHTPSLQPQKYEKKGGDWYNQDDMQTVDALEGRQNRFLLSLR